MLVRSRKRPRSRPRAWVNDVCVNQRLASAREPLTGMRAKPFWRQWQQRRLTAQRPKRRFGTERE